MLIVYKSICLILGLLRSHIYSKSYQKPSFGDQWSGFLHDYAELNACFASHVKTVVGGCACSSASWTCSRFIVSSSSALYYMLVVLSLKECILASHHLQGKLIPHRVKPAYICVIYYFLSVNAYFQHLYPISGHLKRNEMIDIFVCALKQLKLF